MAVNQRIALTKPQRSDHDYYLQGRDHLERLDGSRYPMAGPRPPPP